MNPLPHTLGLEERYLGRLRRALRGLPARDRAAIVGEIAMHIAERSREPHTRVADVLAGLGDPVVLAHAYLDDPEPGRARSGASSSLPWAAMLRGLTLGVSRFLAGFMAASFGTSAVLLVAVAALKPIAPRSVGLWVGHDHFAFGLLAAPGPPAAEVLGLWIVPVSVLAALLCFRASAALIKLSGRWLNRRPGAIALA